VPERFRFRIVVTTAEEPGRLGAGASRRGTRGTPRTSPVGRITRQRKSSRGFQARLICRVRRAGRVGLRGYQRDEIVPLDARHVHSPSKVLSGARPRRRLLCGEYWPTASRGDAGHFKRALGSRRGSARNRRPSRGAALSPGWRLSSDGSKKVSLTSPLPMRSLIFRRHHGRAQPLVQPREGPVPGDVRLRRRQG
jgi:hypothetical protein